MKAFLRHMVPNSIWGLPRRLNVKPWKGESRIFCISFQRTGTTSFGDFFEQFDFPRAGYGHAKYNKWSLLWRNGEFDKIFNSKDFKLYQVFEDGPWWFPHFYEEIYRRFPNSKFVLIERPADKWFSSMKSLNNGKSLGNTKTHATIYKRLNELKEKQLENKAFQPHDFKIDNLLELEGWDEHYKNIYNNHIKEVKRFFEENSPQSLLCVELEDSNKWNKIADFIGFAIPENFKIHSNKTIQPHS